MFTARPVLPVQLKKDTAPVSVKPFPWFPKSLRRALTGLHARLRPRQASRQGFVRVSFILLCIVAGTLVSVSLLLDTLSRSADDRILVKARAARVAPLSPVEFSTLLHHLRDENASKDRFSDPALISAARRHWTFPPADLPKLAWDAIADDVAIAVKTGHEVASRRLRVLRETGWLSNGRRIPNLLVVSDDDNPAEGVIGLKRYALDLIAGRLPNTTQLSGPLPQHWFDRKGWLGDKDKNLPALHMLRSVFPNKKWYLLLDDDTYIFLDNFARYATRPELNERPVYTGKVFYISNCGGFGRSGAPKNNPFGQRGLFAHGGSGIFANAHAMNLVYPLVPRCISEFSGCWAGDMQVGLCMHKAGLQVNNFHNGHSHEYQFTPFWPSRAMADSRYTRRLRSALQPITFHKIPARELELMSAFEKQCIRRGEPVAYSPLREHLMENGIQPTFGKHKTRWDTDVFMPNEAGNGDQPQ